MNAKRGTWLAAALLVAAVFAAYANTFRVPLLFDDLPSILDNPSIRSWRTAWSPPRSFGFTVSGRPLLNLSLAANYALGGFDVRGYHALNLLIHTAAGLVLFGLARRTLRRPVVAPALRAHADAAAFALALLWTLHPLQTEAVTYIIQRAESLMGLFFLLTLYCFARAAESTQPHRWLVGAIVACAAGMGCKEVMVTAPLVVLLYDRTFVAGEARAAWRSRRGFYVALFATWLPLLWLVIFKGGDRGGTFNFTPAAIAGYWLAQFEALACYLKLAVWPAPLVFDYGWFTIERVGQVAPAALVVVAGAGATLWALWRRPVAGFCGACFFIVLSPTSLMPGTVQIIVEHRMYLPLAAVLALATGGAVAWLGRRGVVALLAIAVGLGALTVRRNADYENDLTLWRDTVAKRPGSAIAQSSLGTAYFQRGQFGDALRCYEASLRLEAGSAQTHYNAGLTLEELGRSAEAVAHYAEATRLLPYFARAHAKLGAGLIAAGRWSEAEPHLIRALQLQPALADAHFNLGVIAAQRGRGDEARAHYADAVRADPTHGEARLNLGIALAQAGQFDAALIQLREAVRLRPALAEAQANLGIVLAETGRLDEAIVSYERALRLRPDYARAHYNLGNALVRQQSWAEAKAHFAEAVRLAPDFAAAREMLERINAVAPAR